MTAPAAPPLPWTAIEIVGDGASGSAWCAECKTYLTSPSGAWFGAMVEAIVDHLATAHGYDVAAP